MQGKVLGSTLIIAGTTIGAGMLAQPIVSAQYGFLLSSVLLVFMWLFMMLAAFYTVELNLKHGEPITIPKLMGLHFGKVGEIIGGFFLLLLFYALLAAYISGATSVLVPLLHLPDWIIALIYVAVFGGLVASYVRLVDVANRFLFMIKMGVFFAVLIMLFDNIQPDFLTYFPGIHLNIMRALPIFIVLFGFHGSIPVLIAYLDSDLPKIRKAIFYGSLIPFILFFLWFVVTLGVIPVAGAFSFQTVTDQHDNLAVFVNVLNHYMRFPFLELLVQAFTFLAITTSFLGVGIGLFDYFMEFDAHRETIFRHIKAGLLTFLLPVFFVLFYPQGFVIAIGYAGIALCMLAIVMPIILSFKMKAFYKEGDYFVMGGWWLRTIVLAIGVAIIIIELSK